MKRLIPLGAIAALLILPACGRKPIEFTPVKSLPITETRVDAHKLTGTELKMHVGSRAKRLEKAGVKTVKLTVQNASDTKLILRPEDIGLDLIPAVDVARITSKSASRGFFKRMGKTLGISLVLPLALQATWLVGALTAGGIGLANQKKALDTYYTAAPIAACAGALAFVIGTVDAIGTLYGRPARNASWKKLLEENSVNKDGVVVPPHSAAQLLLFTSHLKKSAPLSVCLSDSRGMKKNLSTTISS